MKFKVGQKVECIVGSMKGKQFFILDIMENGHYICLIASSKRKYYEYSNDWLKAI